MFQGYTFLIIKSKELSDTEAAQLETVLCRHNATKVYSKDEFDNSTNYFDPPSITHIVTNSIDFIEYSQAQKSMIPIVTPEWVHNSVSQSTMLPIKSYNQTLIIFSEIALFVVLIICPREIRSSYMLQYKHLEVTTWTYYPSTPLT